ncbi:hypothetical protein [Microbacterium dauci]|uniref:Transcriptional regulator n=1 Tax=Microbacterium dauci TaxID=3048008 RepID=A0ABT6ZG83_9MICO|nr:hypothetical protein [Microbacterium sp. LX3-4]MDJ1114943.1 hypothetical protein [Microbacterium sp. LX3-4]
MSFGAYEGLSDLAGLPREVQIAALMGLITSDGAAPDEIVTIIAANLSGPVTDSEGARQAFLARIVLLRRKPWAYKLELLELVWPHRWTSIAPILARLRTAAGHRNDIAHSYTDVDIGGMLATGRDLREIDPSDYWRRSSTRSGEGIATDLEALESVRRELRELTDSLTPLYHLDSHRSAPMNIDWHMQHPTFLARRFTEQVTT